MSDIENEIFEIEDKPKPKRKLTEAQLAGLAKGRAKMAEKRAAKEKPAEKPKTKAQIKKEEAINKAGEKQHVAQTKQTAAEKRAVQRKANARKKVEENARKKAEDKAVDQFEDLKYNILSKLECVEAYSLCESKLESIDRQTILDKEKLKSRLLAIQDELKTH